MKVGGPDFHGHRRKFFRPKPHLPPKSVISDFGHFIIAKMPKMFAKKNCKDRKKL